MCVCVCVFLTYRGATWDMLGLEALSIWQNEKCVAMQADVGIVGALRN